MIDKFGLAIITVFGIGHLKHAPGTAVSFVTTLIYCLLFTLKVSFIIPVITFICLFILSIFLIKKLSKNFKKKDPPEIVIDEFIGISVPILLYYFLISENPFDLIPIGVSLNKIFYLYSFMIFVFFRLFDIFKPFPINKVDKNLKNEFGIVLDDVLAGIYTWLTIEFIDFFFMEQLIEIIN